MNGFPWFYMSILFGSAMLGSTIYFFTRKQSSNSIKLLLSFSAAYLLGLTLLHLFPELFAGHLEDAGWYVLAGFMLQVVLDFFSHGIEHGHAHENHHHGEKFIYMVMISLWIHAFIEGMPFGGVLESHQHDHGGPAHHHHHGHDHRDGLLVGIGLHKVTESLVFTALLLSGGISRVKAIVLVVLFAMVAPMGALTNYYLQESGSAFFASLTPKVTGVLIGIILHVSTMILFESEEGHKFNWWKFGSILLGIAVAALVS